MANPSLFLVKCGVFPSLFIVARSTHRGEKEGEEGKNFLSRFLRFHIVSRKKKMGSGFVLERFADIFSGDGVLCLRSTCGDLLEMMIDDE